MVWKGKDLPSSVSSHDSVNNWYILAFDVIDDDFSYLRVHAPIPQEQ